jgi:hypothetical protein
VPLGKGDRIAGSAGRNNAGLVRPGDQPAPSAVIPQVTVLGVYSYEPPGEPCISQIVPAERSFLPLTPWIWTEIEIDAPPDVVWKVLTDFSGYGLWNPFVRRIAGELIVGERLRVLARLPCGLPMLLWPRVLEFEIERKIAWLGSLLRSGLLDGEHHLILEPLGKNKVRFIQREEYTGVLLPILWSWLRDQGHGAFEMMNMALKAASERLSGNSFEADPTKGLR